MSITDELREWGTGAKPAVADGCLISVDKVTYASKKALFAIADRIDAEHQKAIRELNNFADASVLLPVDADGEVIHIGDEMEYGEARGHVIALMLSNYPKKWGGALHWGIQLEGEHAPTALDGFFRHHHAPTVEDVLTEFGIDWEYERDCEDRAVLLKEYAAKLRLAEEDA